MSQSEEADDSSPPVEGVIKLNVFLDTLNAVPDAIAPGASALIS